MRHPPFFSGTGEGPKLDYMTKEGAHVLAAMIRTAWASAGHHVEPVVVQAVRGRDGRPVFGVRMPELVNGLVRAP